VALTRPPRLHDGSRDLERAVAELRERLPEPLAALARLAFNYRWTWLPDGATVFSHVDPALWGRSGGNPRWLLEAAAPRRLRELAGDPGYVKRVAELVARFDEELARPPAALGPAETRQVRDLIKQLRAEGIGIFLISHDIHDVFDLADRISVMLQGKLVGTVNKDDVTVDQVLAMIIMGKKPGEVTQSDIAGLH